MRNAIAVTILTLASVSAYTRGLDNADHQTPATPERDTAELRQLHDEDQADRSASGEINWTNVVERDRRRRARVMSLFAENRLRSADDYYHAAMVLQHGETPDDVLLAHELSVAAIIKGKNDRAARWLAAAAEDRFLTRIGRPQRFATQFSKQGNAPWQLDPVDPAITDELRAVMGAPPLADAQAKVAEMNKP